MRPLSLCTCCLVARGTMSDANDESTDDNNDASVQGQARQRGQRQDAAAASVAHCHGGARPKRLVNNNSAAGDSPSSAPCSPGNDDEDQDEEELGADLPRSFFPAALDEAGATAASAAAASASASAAVAVPAAGSTAAAVNGADASGSVAGDIPNGLDSDAAYDVVVGNGEAIGVSGPGESNLSSEVAELLRSRNRRRTRSSDEQSVEGDANGIVIYPELMDFLEMDLAEDDSDLDSGRGEDEKVVESKERSPDIDIPYDEDRHPLPRGAEALPSASVIDRIPDTLDLSSEPTNASAAGGGGISSVPAVTPVREDLSLMVRSLSLNSPLQGLRKGPCLISGGRSGSDTEALNREACEARLSQREKMVFISLTRGDHPSLSHTSKSNNESRDGNEYTYSAPPVERTMIWTQLEAHQRQVTQVGTSACGATAVINVLLALEVPHTLEAVLAAVKTRMRAEGAPLPQYLLSRSAAGATHVDLIQAIEKVSKGGIVSRFFPMYPRRSFSLSLWLSEWMRKGAVGIATLNLQKGLAPGQTLPDAWHHQMIFGVGPEGIYLTNPLERVPESVLMEQLSSPSELLVRRSDVTSRYDPFNCDLTELTRTPDERWDWYNVVGQVAHHLRHSDTRGDKGPKDSVAEYIRIPATYESGITLCLRRESKHCRELETCPDLPVAVAAAAEEEF